MANLYFCSFNIQLGESRFRLNELSGIGIRTHHLFITSLLPQPLLRGISAFVVAYLTWVGALV